MRKRDVATQLNVLSFEVRVIFEKLPRLSIIPEIV